MRHVDQKIVCVVVGLCAAACLVFLQLLHATHGPVTLRVSAQAATDVHSAVLPVTLVDSAAAAAHFAAMAGSKPGGHTAHIAAWREALEALRADVRIAGDEELLSSRPDGRVLVLPSVAVLSDTAVEALSARIAAGQAVVVSWQLGLYQPGDVWRGYSVLERWFGVQAVLPPPEAPAFRFGVTRAGQPLNTGLPAGGRFEIQPFDAPLWFTAVHADAEWRRWELLPLDDALATAPPVAVTHRMLGHGRVAWLNFEPATAVPASRETTTSLVTNALRWTAGMPQVAIDRWPGGASAAVMVGIDTEDRFENGAMIALVLAKAKVPGTFFCLSSMAERFPAVVTQLAAAGEVASHTDDHRVVAGRLLEEQAQHLRASAASLQALGVPPVSGFRPPEEESDANTLQALGQVGYDYIAGPRDKDRAEPMVMPNGIVVLPRVVRDDLFWINHGLADDADALANHFLDDVHQIRDLGGLAFISVHSQSLERAPVRTAITSLVMALSKEDVWRATGRDIAGWWVARDGITVRADLPQPKRLQLTITARSAVPEVGFTVYLPSRPNRATVGAAVALPPRELRILPDVDPAIRLVLDRLRAGETRVIDIDLQ